jgi:hypothetical protein
MMGKFHNIDSFVLFPLAVQVKGGYTGERVGEWEWNEQHQQ